MTGARPLTFEVERPEHHRAVAALLRGAFAGPAEAALVEALRAEPSYLPALAWVALAEGEVVGYSLLTPLRIRTDDGSSIPGLALAPVAVLPGRQRQGIGSAVVRASLEAARAAGHRGVWVLGDPLYYARFGFTAEPDVEIPWPAEPGAFQRLALVPGALEGVRGRAEYLAPFLAL